MDYDLERYRPETCWQPEPEINHGINQDVDEAITGFTHVMGGAQAHRATHYICNFEKNGYVRIRH